MDLTFESVTKFYGPVIGINNISFRVSQGVTGLFGANGAGKSTLLKLASGQLKPTLGKVLIGDRPAWTARAKRDFGYSPDANTFYESMSGREFVLTMTKLYGYSRRESRERTEMALEAVGMTDRAGRKIAACSHGMRQRIKLAQTLVHDPPILLLDEPMTGIDPGGRREFKRLLMKLAEQGKTILISTHILDEVQDLARSMLMIARGRLIASGTLEEVRQQIENEPLTVEVAAPNVQQLAACLIESGVVSALQINGNSAIVRTAQPTDFFRTLNDLVCQRQVEVQKLEVLDAGADAVFGYLTGSNSE